MEGVHFLFRRGQLSSIFLSNCHQLCGYLSRYCGLAEAAGDEDSAR